MSEIRKRRGIWHLPGGSTKYLDTLNRCLVFVRDASPTREQLTQWFLDTFPLVHSKKTTEGYIGVFERQLGLIKEENGRMILSERGKMFAERFDLNTFFRIITEQIDGVNDIFQLLSGKPNSLQVIHSSLKTRFGWKTPTQTRIRLNFLTSAGLIAKSGRDYSLTDEGRKALEGIKPGESGIPLPSIVEEPDQPKLPQTPNHNEIRDMILEIGKFGGKTAEIEYPIDGLRLDAVWKRIPGGDPSHAFEVQVGGNFFEAFTKLKHAWDKWNSTPFLIITEKYESSAKSLLEGSFHEIKHVTRIVNWHKIADLYRAEKLADQIKKEIDLK